MFFLSADEFYAGQDEPGYTPGGGQILGTPGGTDSKTHASANVVALADVAPTSSAVAATSTAFAARFVTQARSVSST